MLELSPEVTAATASASSILASWSALRSKPDPSTMIPLKSAGRRRKALRFRSMAATECPSASRVRARPEPTRPHPAMTMCIGPFKQVARASGEAAANFGMGHTAAVDDPQKVPVASSRPLAPDASVPSGAETYPESWAYRLKNRILGPPMVSEQLTQERLSTPVAIGVLAP